MLGSPALKALKPRSAKVLISDRLRSIREEKNLSQGDIEKRRVAPLLRLVGCERPYRSSR